MRSATGPTACTRGSARPGSVLLGFLLLLVLLFGASYTAGRTAGPVLPDRGGPGQAPAGGDMPGMGLRQLTPEAVSR